MRPPDPASLPGVALSGTDPAPERQPEWRLPPEWPGWTMALVGCLMGMIGACAYAEAQPGWQTTASLVVLYAGAAIGFGATRVVLPLIARRANAAEQAQLVAANAIPRATIDRVIMHGMATDPVAFVHAMRRRHEAHRQAGLLYEAEFWARVSLRIEEILCGKRN